MEYAIFISKVDELSLVDPNFSRLYYGNEFCQELIPSLEALERILDNTHDLKLTLVTPYVTDEGLAKLAPLLNMLSRKREDAEVVFNDWGVFHTLRREYTTLQPVMGRLLNKMKRCPRISKTSHVIPKEDIHYFKSSNLTLKLFHDFLISNGVRRVEFDNLIQGFDLNSNGIDLSLYTPFVYVTTTRYCLANACDIPHKKGVVGIFPCKKECQRYTFFLKHKVMPVTLLRKGNTLFFKNETIPKNIGIFSRIVIEPKVPM
jgi:hypothetical protein